MIKVFSIEKMSDTTLKSSYKIKEYILESQLRGNQITRHVSSMSRIENSSAEHFYLSTNSSHQIDRYQAYLVTY